MPPRAPTAETLRSYRVLMLLVAAGNAAFAAVHLVDGTPAVDPLWLRAAVSALALGVAATLGLGLRRHARVAVYVVAYVLVGVSALLCLWNGFAPSYALTYLALVAALALGGAVTSQHAGASSGMMAASVLVPLAGIAWTPAPGVSRVAFALSLLATAGVAVAAARERTRTAARALGEQARYRSVFENATDGLYLADAPSRRVLDANPAMLALSGYTLAEIRRLRVDDLIDADPQAIAANVAAACTTGRVIVGPRRLRCVGGLLVDVEVSATVIDTGDGADTLSVVVRDATRQRAAERALEAAAREADAARERAEELLRLKASFLANMSHEIRTPLTAILGYSDLLADEVSGDARDMVAVIARGATRLHRTLNSVLDLARLDADQSPLGVAPVDVAAEVRAAVGLLQPLAEARGLSLTAEADGPAVALAEAGALARVLDNLIGNAIKFTEAGRVTVSVVRDGPHVRVAVQDTGVGIPEAFRGILFSEFRQASSGHGRTHEGSGLGLAITQRLVARMGGEITVESAEGAGSTFTVALTAAAPVAAEAVA